MSQFVQLLMYFSVACKPPGQKHNMKTILTTGLLCLLIAALRGETGISTYGRVPSGNATFSGSPFIIPPSTCSPGIDNSLAGECTPKKGFYGNAGSAVAGAEIKVYDLSGNLQTPNAGSIYSSGTITANPDGSWTWKCNGNDNCPSGANNCLPAGVYGVTQTVSGYCESDPIYLCLGNNTTSATPVISGSPTISSTSVSGTSGASASIILYARNYGVTTQLGTGTANGSGAWSISGLTLNLCDTLYAIAIEPAKCLSLASADKAVTGSASSAPVITGTYCTNTSITSVTGTSTEAAGTSIQLYENGTAEGSPVTVQSGGGWSISSGISIAGGNTITARASASCKSQSADSDPVTILSGTSDPLLSITSNPVVATQSSVSGTATTGNTIVLYIDGSTIGSPVVASSGAWTVSGLLTGDLYTGGVLSVTAAEPGGCDGTPVSGPTVQCLPPDTTLTLILQNDTICNGATASVEIQNSQSGIEYTLYYDGTPTGIMETGNGNDITITTGNLTANGNLSIHAVDPLDAGCEIFFADSFAIVLEQPAAPVITISWQSFPCENDTAVLVSSYGNSILWNTGETTDQITTMDPGNYTVTYTDGSGCTASATENIFFNPLPSKPVIAATGVTAFCPGGSQLMTTGYTAGLTYQWRRFGNNLTGEDTTLFTATLPGKYRVRVTDSNGCTSISDPVELSSGPFKPDITSSGPTTVCFGDTVTLQADPYPGLTYYWRKYGNIINGATGVTYHANSEGTYTCVATDVAGCTKVSNVIEVINMPQAVTISAGGPVVFCPGGSVTLTATTIAGVSYTWKRNKFMVQGAVSNIYSATQGGKFRCIITDTNGCSRTSNMITVTESCRVESPEALLPKLNLFPNPSSDRFNIQIPITTETHENQIRVRVTDITGQPVKFEWTRQSGGLYSISGLNEGIYIATITTPENTNEFRLVRVR